MSCQVRLTASDGSTTPARALSDSASSTSFITERLAQRLHLPWQHRPMQISGIGGTTAQTVSRSVVNFKISSSHREGKAIAVEVVVFPKVTTEIPSTSVSFNTEWKHLIKLQLADPDFGTPGNVDLIMGADLFCRTVRYGRRYGPPGSPSTFKTSLRWVLAGAINTNQTEQQLTTYCASNLTGDDLPRKFWEMEDCNFQKPSMPVDKKSIVKNFEGTHTRVESSRFIVPLPRKAIVTPLGESHSKAAKRFLNLERSFAAKGSSSKLTEAMHEYFEMWHSESVPVGDLGKDCKDVYYLPMHVVTKASSTMTIFRIVIDESTKSDTGMSLNDQFLVGPTVHSSLVDVLFHFCCHKRALTADVSHMYCAVLIPDTQQVLHHFIWREN